MHGTLRTTLGEVKLNKLHLSQGLCAQEDGQHIQLVDPTYSEAKQSDGLLSMAFIPAMATVTGTSFNGSAPRAVVKEGLRSLQTSCTDIHSIAAQALKAELEQPNGTSK